VTIDVKGVLVQLDAEDYDRCVGGRAMCWAAGRPGMKYVMVSGRHYLHRLITGAGRGELVDHINRDRADNRHVNLRIVGHKESVENRGLNRNNTTGIKGVSPYRGRYRAARNGQHLGVYSSKEAAQAAYERHQQGLDNAPSL
jgi:hypothetical protein